MIEITEKHYVDVSTRSLLAMDGTDGLDLLQRISTNDLSRLAIGEHMATILTNEKGRIVDVVTVFKTSEDRLVLSGASTGDVQLSSWIDRFVVTENVKLSSLSGSHFQLLVLNSNIEKLTSDIVSDNLFIAETKDQGIQQSVLIGPCASKPSITSYLARNSIFQLTDEEFEAYRVHHRIPGYDKELSVQFNPLEVGLESLVSFTKGCYVGQEVIARLDTYQKSHRALELLRLTSLPADVPTSLWTEEGKDAGMLTSWAELDGRIEGLGIVRREYRCDRLRYLTSENELNGQAKAADHQTTN